MASFVVGCLTFAVFTLNSAVWLGLILLVTAAKLAVPLDAWRRALTRLQLALAVRWVSGNNLALDLTQRIVWETDDLSHLDPGAWYVLIANHRSWVDIVAVQHTFNRRITPVRYFFKKQLLWVPLLGQACWALDMPFVAPPWARTNTPEEKAQDAARLRLFCERFRAHPTGVLVFVEATRFSRTKHAQQQSPYRHLVLPRPGALAATLDGMRGKIEAIIDVTIVYPHGTPSFWDLLSRRIPRIVVRVDVVPTPAIPEDESARRETIQSFLNDRWSAKDERIERELGGEVRS